MLEPCNHIFHNECIIRCLRTNGPRCPSCRGVYIRNNNYSESNIHLNNNSSEFDFYNLDFTENQGYNNPTYFENITTVNIPTYYNIVYDSTGNDVTSYVNNLTFNNETITYVPTNTISPNIITIETTNISNNE
tara:strand:- start:351 stop:749 length:399 start_codon:yes stop_codon:yes gene_type:complete